MKLSIIMPLYNMENKVERTLKHFTTQNTHDTEIIIVNDGSTDNTREIIESYLAILPINLINLATRETVGKARNIGISHAVGEYLFFCDGDDLMFIDTVFEIINEMEKHNVPISIAEYKEYDWVNDCVLERNKGIRWDIVKDKVIVYPKEYMSDLFQITNITCWNKVYKCDFIKKEEIRFPNTNYLEDLVFVFECLLKASKVLLSKEACYCYSLPTPGRKSMLNSMDGSLIEYLNALVIMNEALTKHFIFLDRSEIEEISKSAIFEYIRLISFAKKMANNSWNSMLDSKSFEIISKLHAESKKRK